FAIVSGQSQKREHHVLMVALQEYAFSSGLFLQTQGQIDDIAGGWSPIDIVADEDDLVAGAGRDGLEDCAELIGASVDVADCEQTSGLGFGVARHGVVRWFQRSPSVSLAPESNFPSISRSSINLRTALYGLVLPAATSPTRSGAPP